MELPPPSRPWVTTGPVPMTTVPELSEPTLGKEIPQSDKVHRLLAGHGCQGLLNDLGGAVALDLRGAGISRVRRAACLEAGRGPPGV